MNLFFNRDTINNNAKKEVDVVNNGNNYDPITNKRRTNNISQSPQHRSSAIGNKSNNQTPPQRQGESNPPPRRQVRGLKDNLRSQTPLNRTLRKQTAPSEPGTARRDNAPQYFKLKTNRKQRTKARRKGNPSLLRFIILTGVIIYAVMIPIIILCVKIALPSHSTPKTKDFVYQLGPDDNVYSSKIYSYTRVRVGDEYYINMDSLAEYCSLTTTGDNATIRYVVRSSGDYVEFVIGQSIAYINGVQERTGATVMLKNNVLYVPVTFAQRCFDGVEINVDESENKITIVRLQDSSKNYLDLSFPYKLPKINDKINFADLDADIQEIIIMQNQPQLPSEDDSQSTQ